MNDPVLVEASTASLMAVRIALTTRSSTEPNSGRFAAWRWSTRPSTPSAW
jgi:hypothetical protein